MACLHHHGDSLWLKLVLGCWVITKRLVQQINKDSRVPVWLRPMYSAAQTYNIHRLAVYCGEDYNKNQNSCGDESISREIGSNIVKWDQHKNEISLNRVNTKAKSHEIRSSREYITWNQVNLVKSGQHNESHEIMSMRDFRFIIQYVNAYVNVDL